MSVSDLLRDGRYRLTSSSKQPFRSRSLSGHLHHEGIIHKDITPSNLIIQSWNRRSKEDHRLRDSDEVFRGAPHHEVSGSPRGHVSLHVSGADGPDEAGHSVPRPFSTPGCDISTK